MRWIIFVLGCIALPIRAEMTWPELVGAQYTWIRQFQSTLKSPYSGPNSLNPEGDVGATHTVGLYFGWALTERLQAYFDVEKFMGSGVSGAVGMGGLTNGDVVRQGGGGLRKTPYVARKYVRYMLPLSGETAKVERAQDQIARAKPVARRGRHLSWRASTWAICCPCRAKRRRSSARRPRSPAPSRCRGWSSRSER